MGLTRKDKKGIDTDIYDVRKLLRAEVDARDKLRREQSKLIFCVMIGGGILTVIGVIIAVFGFSFDFWADKLTWRHAVGRHGGQWALTIFGIMFCLGGGWITGEMFESYFKHEH